eukprot:10336267-Prorocentrum_lima.AAC.1
MNIPRIVQGNASCVAASTICQENVQDLAPVKGGKSKFSPKATNKQTEEGTPEEKGQSPAKLKRPKGTPKGAKGA